MTRKMLVLNQKRSEIISTAILKQVDFIKSKMDKIKKKSNSEKLGIVDDLKAIYKILEHIHGKEYAKKNYFFQLISPTIVDVCSSVYDENDSESDENLD